MSGCDETCTPDPLCDCFDDSSDEELTCKGHICDTLNGTWACSCSLNNGTANIKTGLSKYYWFVGVLYCAI